MASTPLTKCSHTRLDESLCTGSYLAHDLTGMSAPGAGCNVCGRRPTDLNLFTLSPAPTTMVRTLQRFKGTLAVTIEDQAAKLTNSPHTQVQGRQAVWPIGFIGCGHYKLNWEDGDSLAQVMERISPLDWTPRREHQGRADCWEQADDLYEDVDSRGSFRGITFDFFRHVSALHIARTAYMFRALYGARPGRSIYNADDHALWLELLDLSAPRSGDHDPYAAPAEALLASLRLRATSPHEIVFWPTERWLGLRIRDRNRILNAVFG